MAIAMELLRAVIGNSIYWEVETARGGKYESASRRVEAQVGLRVRAGGRTGGVEHVVVDAVLVARRAEQAEKRGHEARGQEELEVRLLVHVAVGARAPAVRRVVRARAVHRRLRVRRPHVALVQAQQTIDDHPRLLRRHAVAPRQHLHLQRSRAAFIASRVSTQHKELDYGNGLR